MPCSAKREATALRSPHVQLENGTHSTATRERTSRSNEDPAQPKTVNRRYSGNPGHMVSRSTHNLMVSENSQVSAAAQSALRGLSVLLLLPRRQEVSAHLLLTQQESESEVAQSCPTLYDPMDCSPPDSSVHGIFQARVLECVAIPFSGGSSRPRDRTKVSRIVGRCFTICIARHYLTQQEVVLKYGPRLPVAEWGWYCKS